MAENKNQCWPGHEPVEGKRPNSQGSCRPKTESKLTDSEKEFRAQRKRQLKKWRVTPVLGSTMLLCTLAAIVLRLNLPAIQLVNGVVYPLQFILLIPFYRLGAWMFRADASTISLRALRR